MVQIGYDYLGAQSDLFNAAAAIRSLNPGSAVGTLHHTFGDKLDNIRALLSNGNVSLGRTHLINGPAIRNQNAGRYEIGYGYTLKSFEEAVLKHDRKITDYVEQATLIYKNLSTKYNKPIWISPILEHNLIPKAWQVLADVVLGVYKDAQLVNNAMDLGNLTNYRGALREYHGTNIYANTEVTSFDGVEAADYDIDRWLKDVRKLKLAFVWSRLYNFRHQGKFEDPRKRTLDVDRFQYDMLAHITDKVVAAPTLPSAKPFVAPMVWKPLAEDKDGTDSKSNAPVAILPLTKNDISVIALNGKEIAKLGYYGNFSGHAGYNRYYSKYGSGSGLQGYQIQKRAQDEGSPWTWVKQGNKLIGPFLAGRRQGDFRE